MSGLASRPARGAGLLHAAGVAVARRAAVRMRPGTALIVPVLDAEPAVAAWLGTDTKQTTQMDVEPSRPRACY